MYVFSGVAAYGAVVLVNTSVVGVYVTTINVPETPTTITIECAVSINIAEACSDIETTSVATFVADDPLNINTERLVDELT